MVSKGQLICLLLASIFFNIVSASKLQDSDGAPCYEKDENGEDLTKAQVIIFYFVVYLHSKLLVLYVLYVMEMEFPLRNF